MLTTTLLLLLLFLFLLTLLLLLLRLVVLHVSHTHTSFSTSRQHQHEFLSWPPHNVHMLSMSGHTGTFDRVYDPEGGPPTTCSNIAVYHLGLKSRSCSPCSAFSMDPACPLRILDLQSVFSVQHGPGVPIEHFRPHC
jgi:hypothetical protein